MNDRQSVSETISFPAWQNRLTEYLVVLMGYPRQYPHHPKRESTATQLTPLHAQLTRKAPWRRPSTLVGEVKTLYVYIMLSRSYPYLTMRNAITDSWTIRKRQKIQKQHHYRRDEGWTARSTHFPAKNIQWRWCCRCCIVEKQLQINIARKNNV